MDVTTGATGAPKYYSNRVVGRSENLGMPVLFGRHNLPPLVDIGSAKSGGTLASPAPAASPAPMAPPGTTS